MAFIPAQPLPAVTLRVARPSVCRRRPRMAALEAPTKQDLRSKLNNLLSMTPTTTPDTDPDRVKQNVDPGRHYHVLIFNDEHNSKEFVTRVLLKVVPGLTPEAASAIMQKAHTSGRAIVGTWIFEISEGFLYRVGDVVMSRGMRPFVDGLFRELASKVSNGFLK